MTTPPDPATTTRPTYREVLRECPGFRLLFSARVTSLLGDWFSVLATIALLREVVGSSAGAISGMLILRLLPIFLAGPLAGVVADRFSRKSIMVLSDLVRVVLVLGLIVTPLTPWPIGTTYLLIALQVVAGTFFEPARSAALPQLVPDRYLATANALDIQVLNAVERQVPHQKHALGIQRGGLAIDIVMAHPA